MAGDVVDALPRVRGNEKPRWPEWQARHLSAQKEPRGEAPNPILAWPHPGQQAVLVPLAGIEPARCCHHLILSQARLPVPPQGLDCASSIITRRGSTRAG